jgi:hypothetical protein
MTYDTFHHEMHTIKTTHDLPKTPLTRLNQPAQQTKNHTNRTGGQLKEGIKITQDFDLPLPESQLKLFYT